MVVIVLLSTVWFEDSQIQIPALLIPDIVILFELTFMALVPVSRKIPAMAEVKFPVVMIVLS